MKNGERSAASRIRQYYSAGLLAVAMLLSITSVTYAASSFYWYGENNSTCWQTGQLGSSSKECSTVGAGYLATPGGHTGGLAYMSEGGASTDLTTLSSSGDYCSYYRLGDQLTYQDSTNEGATTGISMPTPYSSYQEGDKTSSAYNACQADGSYWGQAVRGPSGGGCSATCGMHHYVSFRGQGTNDRPWSAAFGEPSLVLSAEAGVYTFSHTGTNYRGWGYVCPELEDTSSHGVLEYCFQEWRSANDPPEWKNERKGECSSPYSQVNTFFWPGTTYATEMPGSTNTFEVGSAGSGHFEAKITETNLKNAAKLINAECAGWHLSESPANYALVGVEQGLEGEAGVSAVGGWTANLQVRTEYTPSSAPPLTVFYAGSGDTLQENWWTGSLWGFYNVGAPLAPGSSPATDPFPNPGQYDEYFRGSNGELQEEYYGGESGWHWIGLGHGMAANATPTIRHPQVGGSTVLYYTGSSGTLQESWWTGEAWGYYNVGVPIAAGSSPAADPHPNAGQDDVYFRGSNGELQEEYYGGESGWHWIGLGHGMAVGTTPTVIHRQVGGETYVFYEGSNGLLQESWWNGREWQWASLGATVEPGTSPSGL